MLPVAQKAPIRALPSPPVSLNLPALTDARMRLKGLLATDGTRTMTITPELAKAMLALNTSNRPINAKTVDRYAEAMRRNEWRLTGESIKFTHDGVLNDGQQRLIACIKADKPFTTDVRFGLDRNVFIVTDIGRRRSQGDALATMHERNCLTLAAGLAWIHRESLGLPGGAHDHCSNARTLELLLQYPEMRESVIVAMRTSVGCRGFQAGPLAFCHWRCWRIDREAADEFFLRVQKGMDITGTDDPIYRLRHRMQGAVIGGRRLLPVDQIALTFKAWNGWRRSEKMVQLSWRHGERGESFPKPI